MELTIQERREILRFVREVIDRELHNAALPEVPEFAQMSEQRACFVTLHDCDGNLRGCIGNIEAFEALGENLKRNALNAAFSDPRFPPLEPDELGETSIEVSVLTPPVEIADPESFEIGKDGIILRAAGRGAVFLPQVAAEQGWDQVTTLNYLARKAGLPEDGWRLPGAKFQTFRAEVFHE